MGKTRKEKNRNWDIRNDNDFQRMDLSKSERRQHYNKKRREKIEYLLDDMQFIEEIDGIEEIEEE
jgi:hypothetical protein